MFVFDIKKHGITFDELIDEIIIGPRSKQSIDELKMYIESKGYSEISKKIINKQLTDILIYTQW